MLFGFFLLNAISPYGIETHAYVRTYIRTYVHWNRSKLHMYTVPFWAGFTYQFLPVCRSVLTLPWRRLSLSCSPSQGDVGWCTQREWTLDCGPSFSLLTSWSARKQPHPCLAHLGLSPVRPTLRRNPSTSAAHWQNRQWRRLDSASTSLSEWCKAVTIGMTNITGTSYHFIPANCSLRIPSPTHSPVYRSAMYILYIACALHCAYICVENKRFVLANVSVRVLWPSSGRRWLMGHEEGQRILTETSTRTNLFFIPWNQRTPPVLMTAPAKKPSLHLYIYVVLTSFLRRIQKSLDQLLRFLDNSVGRPLMATQVAGKTEEELCGWASTAHLLIRCIQQLLSIVSTAASLPLSTLVILTWSLFSIRT